MFVNYFKTTIRNLWKNKTYSLLNVLGLSIGIACAALLFLWIEDEVTYDHINVKKDRLYQVKVNMKNESSFFTMGSTPRPMATVLKNEVPGIVNTARVSDRSEQLLFNLNDKAVYANGKYADATLFNMFSFSFIEGNAQTAFKQLYSLVITESTARKFFGAEKNIIGKTLRVDNKQDYVITGIVKDVPKNSTLQFEWLAPYEIALLPKEAEEAEKAQSNAASWDSYGPFTYVELAAHANIETINQQIKDLIHQKAADQQSQIFLFPMKDWHLRSEFKNGKTTGGGKISQVFLYAGIAWIILLIACINFMNLATANSQTRVKEIGVRKVLGAARKKLVAQFITEALFMSFMATILAVIIVALTLPAFNTLMQKQLHLSLMKPAHIVAALLIILICGFIAGSYPSLYLSAFKPISVLKGWKLKTGHSAMVRKGLVVFQFAISIIFIITTLVVYLQVQHVKNRQLGFDKDNLMEIDMQHDITNNFPQIKEDLLRTGVIQHVALSDHSTIYGGNTDKRFRWQGKPENEKVEIAFRNVSPEFVSTMGMKIMAGRDFNGSYHTESSNIIITRSMERMMGRETAVGKIIQTARGNNKGVFTNLTVVGVVEDYVFGNMYQQDKRPVIFLCKPPQDENLLYVRIQPGSQAAGTLAKIESVMKKNNPAYPLKYKFVDEQFNRMFLDEILTSKVSGIFSMLAIIISCLGLFGLATYTAQQRIKEIGVRKVLGASVAGITALLSKDFLKLVALSCGIAFPVAWQIMHTWLLNYEYRIQISWWVFLTAGFTALLIALITISFQSIKAAMANPINSLRTE